MSWGGREGGSGGGEGREEEREGGREGGRRVYCIDLEMIQLRELTHNWKSMKAPSDFPIQLDCIDFTPLGQSSPSRPCSRD